MGLRIEAYVPAEFPEELRKLHTAVVLQKPIDGAPLELLEEYVQHCARREYVLPGNFCSIVRSRYTHMEARQQQLSGLQGKILAYVQRVIDNEETAEHPVLKDTQSNQPMVVKSES